MVLKSSGNDKTLDALSLTWDESGNISDANDELLRKCGLTKQEFEKRFRHVDDFFVCPKWDWLKEHMNEGLLVCSELICSNFILLVRSKGVDSLITLKFASIEQNDSGYHAVIGKDASSLPNGMVENSPIGIFASTLYGDFLQVNPKLAEIYGYTSEEEFKELDIANDIYDDPSARDELIRHLRDIALREKQQSIYNYVFVGRHKNGRRLLISKDVYPMYGCNELVYFYGYVRDITKEIGEADSSIPTCVFGKSGQIIYANEAMSDFIGYSQEELQSKDDIDLYIDRKEQRQFFREILKDGRKYNRILRLIRKDGSHVKVSVNASLFSCFGKPVYIKCQASEGHHERSGLLSLIEEINNLLEFEKLPLLSEVFLHRIKNVVDSAQSTAGIILNLQKKEASEIADNVKKEIQRHEKRWNGKTEVFSSISKEFLGGYSLDLTKVIENEILVSISSIFELQVSLKNALNIEQVSHLLDVDVEGVISRITKGKLFAVQFRGEYRFPLFQFEHSKDSSFGLLEKLNEVLEELNHLSQYARLSWLTSPSPYLSQRIPYEILKKGTLQEKHDVVEAARSIRRE